jgi:hypothetical protein
VPPRSSCRGCGMLAMRLELSWFLMRCNVVWDALVTSGRMKPME